MAHARGGDFDLRALALGVAADCIDHGEEAPRQFERVLSIA
jgi:hypothetical protein